ncbi:hypothetical protein [Phaeobacter sp. B1627]|uniref:hypothetical protein n=1 Tax=Phaeobacter sp. B1627 TaxID=2583809 RepID=UPI00111BBDD8|nr:hypothetical protein [Phaeobacter sp. B1627]TNJ47775.1 hypothetical protein FGE21_04240 [Phaeobacter sp. B1627]
MRGMIALLVGLLAYAGMLFLSKMLFAQGIETQGMRLLVSLSPMLPAAFICGVIIWQIRHLDEMQRKLQFEALALAVAGTALITFGYGFLEGAGFPKLSMFVVLPLISTIWFIGVMLGRLRFR